jgi:MFS family permease
VAKCRTAWCPPGDTRPEQMLITWKHKAEAVAISTNDGSGSLWRPLRSSTFRNLLVADVVSDVGTFMQSVGAAWLMVSLNAGPMYVALTQTASALPFFILALPAGAIGDIVDRRKVILFTEIWMVVVAAVLAVMTIAGKMSPVLLLILTFALSAGDAFETPTWRAVLPELVEKEDLPAASALNGIEFNFARAVGPALAGFVIAFVGIGAAFLLNTLSFFGVILVVARWTRPAVKRTTPPETVTGATVAAIRYVRYSPGVRIVLLRAGAAMFFASGLLALLPSIAHRSNDSPVGYGMLLGGFGCGAVLGALVMQRSIPVVGRRDRIGRYRDLRPVDNRGRNATRVGAASCGDARRRCGLGLLHLALQCSSSKPDTGLGARPCARGFDAGVSRSGCRRKCHLGRGGGTGRPWQGATVGRRRNNSVNDLGIISATAEREH